MWKRVFNTGTKLKRKTTNAAKQTMYMAMWNEEVPKKYKRCGGKK